MESGVHSYKTACGSRVTAVTDEDEEDNGIEKPRLLATRVYTFTWKEG